MKTRDKIKIKVSSVSYKYKKRRVGMLSIIDI